MSTEEWSWRMDYCRKRRIPPGEVWAWEQAGTAFAEQETCDE